MHADADLSLPGIARLVAEFLDRLDLHDVTLVGNDTGGALVQLLMRDGAARVGRVVLVSCDAFDNFPPGLTGKTLVLTGKLSPLDVRAVHAADARSGSYPAAPDRVRLADPARRRCHRPVDEAGPDATRDPPRRRTHAAGVAADTELLLAAAEHLPSFNRPALVVWASGDRVMPPEHGRRLADLLPQGRLVEVDDSYTLIPLDQPARVAQVIREFTHASDRT